MATLVVAMENILSFGSTVPNPYSYLNSQLVIKNQDDESVNTRIVKVNGAAVISNIAAVNTDDAKIFYEPIFDLELVMVHGWMKTFSSGEGMTT
jgi:hypothetical protein